MTRKVREQMMWVYRADAYIAGFFVGCLTMSLLMLGVPRPTKCEVSIMKQGSQVEIVHVGVVRKY